MSPGAESDTRHALRSARATCTSLSRALQSPTLPPDVRRVLEACRLTQREISEALRGLLFQGRVAVSRPSEQEVA